jgi:hypothetical protein
MLAEELQRFGGLSQDAAPDRLGQPSRSAAAGAADPTRRRSQVTGEVDHFLTPVHIHSIVTTSTGWETPFRVTVRGVEIGNRVAASCTVVMLADLPATGKAADPSGLVDSSSGKVDRAGGSLRLV